MKRHCLTCLQLVLLFLLTTFYTNGLQTKFKQPISKKVTKRKPSFSFSSSSACLAKDKNVQTDSISSEIEDVSYSNVNNVSGLSRSLSSSLNFDVDLSESVLEEMETKLSLNKRIQNNAIKDNRHARAPNDDNGSIIQVFVSEIHRTQSKTTTAPVFLVSELADATALEDATPSMVESSTNIAKESFSIVSRQKYHGNTVTMDTALPKDGKDDDTYHYIAATAPKPTVSIPIDVELEVTRTTSEEVVELVTTIIQMASHQTITMNMTPEPLLETSGQEKRAIQIESSWIVTTPGGFVKKPGELVNEDALPGAILALSHILHPPPLETEVEIIYVTQTLQQTIPMTPLPFRNQPQIVIVKPDPPPRKKGGKVIVTTTVINGPKRPKINTNLLMKNPNTFFLLPDDVFKGVTTNNASPTMLRNAILLVVSAVLASLLLF